MLGRIRASNLRRRLPGCTELLGGESLHAGVREDAGQRRGESEAVGQHVLRAGLAKILSVVIVAVKDRAKNPFGAREIYISFLNRRAGRVPAAGGDILRQPGVIVR